MSFETVDSPGCVAFTEELGETPELPGKRMVSPRHDYFARHVTTFLSIHEVSSIAGWFM